MYTNLEQSPLFRGLKSDEIENLLNNTPHQLKSFRKNELLAVSGDKVRGAMILIEGSLHGEMLDFSGNSLKIEELSPPQMVAAAFLFGKQSIFPVNLSALSDGKLVFIAKNDFTGMLTQNPGVLDNYLNIVSNKAQFLSRKISFLNFKTIREKIAFFLLQNHPQNQKIIQIKQNQTVLAELFGVARPSLARTIGDMQRDGMFIWRKKEVEILNTSLLKKVLMV
jgi:CRP-like cAMP-binding protein